MKEKILDARHLVYILVCWAGVIELVKLVASWCGGSIQSISVGLYGLSFMAAMMMYMDIYTEKEREREKEEK